MGCGTNTLTTDDKSTLIGKKVGSHLGDLCFDSAIILQLILTF
jgi:hypothetical protein